MEWDLRAWLKDLDLDLDTLFDEDVTVRVKLMADLSVLVRRGGGSRTPIMPPQGLAAKYPQDANIENDPAVIFVERFDQASTAALLTHWGDGRLNTASFSTDVPAGFASNARSLQCPRLVGDDGAQLYTHFDGHDQVYCRYYVKYGTGGPPNHCGVWMGGYEPPSGWPSLPANSLPTGTERFGAAAEKIRPPFVERFDHYNYWMGMHDSNGDGTGTYYGNTLLNDPAINVPLNTWICIEHMIKVNTPTTAFNGEHAIWIDGTKVSHLGEGFPHGTWLGGNFTQNASAPTTFEGFRWRTVPELDVDWIWLQAWVDRNDTTLVTTTWFSNVIVATEYIGPLQP